MHTDGLLSMAELISHVEQQTSNAAVVYDHYKAGTIDSLYKSIVENTVIEMMLMPLRRHERGLPLLDDPESISKDVNTIANIIGTVCSKSTTAVEIDLMAAVHDFPADDVRQASVLRKNNLLC